MASLTAQAERRLGAGRVHIGQRRHRPGLALAPAQRSALREIRRRRCGAAGLSRWRDVRNRQPSLAQHQRQYTRDRTRAGVFAYYVRQFLRTNWNWDRRLSLQEIAIYSPVLREMLGREADQPY